jgi:methylthioribose-1-phosphate isomerase
MINTIFYEDGMVHLLNQNELPGRVEYMICKTHQEIALAIKNLNVRGAPLIGIAAAFGLALAVKNYNGPSSGIKQYYQDAETLLASTRPTAVNLFAALQRMRRVFDQYAGQDDLKNLAAQLLAEAGNMFYEDIRINKAIGENGQVLLGQGARVLTLCNAGALATCGYGTALGVIRSAHQRHKIMQVWACETRPVLQGSRLTVWELWQDNIPVTLITDSMAAYVMSLKQVDAIIVGADRIAANGDTANKIGTYSLAILAHYHEIPFYVAAPLSTIDWETSSARSIPIEERNPDEVRQLGGHYTPVDQVDVFNPAFDVTPAHLIKAIITEQGIIAGPVAEGLAGMRKEVGI